MKHAKHPHEMPPEIQDWRQRQPVSARNLRQLVRDDTRRLREAREAFRDGCDAVRLSHGVTST